MSTKANKKRALVQTHWIARHEGMLRWLPLIILVAVFAVAFTLLSFHETVQPYVRVAIVIVIAGLLLFAFYCQWLLIDELNRLKTVKKTAGSSRRLLDIVVSTAPVRIFWKDREGKYLGCNELFAGDAGLSSPADLIGKTDHDMVWRDQAELYRADDLMVINSGVPKLAYIEPQTTPDGRQMWARTSKVPLKDNQGKIIGMLGMYEDVTKQVINQKNLMESEVRFRTIIEFSPVPMALNDDEGNITYINHAFEQTFGYQLEDIPTLESWWPQAYPDPEYRQMLANQWQVHLENARATGAKFEALEARITCKNGNIVTALVGAVSLGESYRGSHLVTLVDISEHRRSEQLIAEREHYLRSLIDGFPFLAWLKNEKGEFLAVNQKFAEASGHESPSLLQGKTDLDIWPVDLANSYHADDLEVIKHGNQKNVTELVEVAGERKWFETYKSPVFAEGKVVGTIGFSRDITDRKEAEILLLRESEKNRAFLRSASDGIHIMDAEGNVIEASHSFCEMLGYSIEEVIGMNVKQWDAGFIKPDELKVKLKENFDSGERVLFETRHRRKDGSIFDVEISAYRIEFDGKEVLFNSSRDITERKLAQASMELLLSEQNAILESGLVGKAKAKNRIIIWCNHSYEAMLGYDQGELIGKSTRLFFPDQDSFELMGNEAYPKLKSGGIFRSEVSFIRKDGKILWVDLSGVMLDPSENVSLWTFADITERKTLKAEQERLALQLQQAQKMEAIGQLTGGIAHDFNNILAAILGYTGLAMDRFCTDKDSKLTSYLTEVKTAGERARDLIAKMLAFSRGTRSKPVSMDVAPLVKEVVKTLHSVIPSSITIEMNVQENLPAVLFDPVQMHQALMNLAINARDAMGMQGRMIITLRARDLVHATCDSCHHDIQGGYVELSLSDTGEGISRENLRRIFDPFFTTKEVGKGTGMGLSMVHGLMHEHGGHILVESQSGKGATFQLLFPVSRVAADLRPMGHLEAHEHQKVSARILVVDDESMVGNMLGEVLEAHGHQATIFTNSVKMLAEFTAAPQNWDLIITDQTMPSLTGVELATQIHAIRPDIPIILCSGYSNVISEEDAEKAGIKSYLQKPVNINELIDEIAKTLNA